MAWWQVSDYRDQIPPGDIHDSRSDLSLKEHKGPQGLPLKPWKLCRLVAQCLDTGRQWRRIAGFRAGGWVQ